MTAVFCPSCLRQVEIPLPVEPLYDKETAAALVPTRPAALQRLLNRHRPFPPHYRLWEHRRYRYYSASEIRWVRELLFHHEIPSRKKKSLPINPSPLA